MFFSFKKLFVACLISVVALVPVVPAAGATRGVSTSLSGRPRIVKRHGVVLVVGDLRMKASDRTFGCRTDAFGDYNCAVPSVVVTCFVKLVNARGRTLDESMVSALLSQRNRLKYVKYRLIGYQGMDAVKLARCY